MLLLEKSAQNMESKKKKKVPERVSKEATKMPRIYALRHEGDEIICANIRQS
jgi:hypothetical protein